MNYTQKEIEYVKTIAYGKGWREGLLIGGMFAVCVFVWVGVLL